MTTFEEIKAQSAVVQAHLDTISDLIHLATTVNNIVQMQAVKIILEAESARMTHESDKLNDLFKQFREEKRKTEEGKSDMKKTIVLVLVMMVVALVLVGIASAQDVPLATNTSEVVATVAAAVNGQPVEATLVAPVENPPAPTQQPISDNMLTVIGLIIFTVAMLIGQWISHASIKEMMATVRKASENKALIDEATSRYMQSSLPVQEYIKLGIGFAQLLGKSIPGEDLFETIGELGKKVTGGGETLPTGEQPGLTG